MDISIILVYIKNNWFQLIIDAVALDHVVLVAAQKAGYTQLTSLCQKFANFLGFIWDVICGFGKPAIKK